jgi:hypothetical protein
VREKIAALLPLPAFLKRRIAGHGADDHGSTASIGGHAATLAQLSTAAASYADPAMHWGKAIAKAAAVAAAVVGAGVVAHDTGLIGGVPRDQRPAAIERPASPSGGDSTLSTRPAANGTSPGASTTSSKGSGAGGNSSSGSPSSGSGSGSQSPSSPAGDDPVKAATGTQLPSADDNPVTKTARKLTSPDSRGLPVKTPTLPSTEVPKVEIPKVEAPEVQVPQVQVPSGLPDPGGVVSGATGTVNDATGAVTGTVNQTTGTVTGTVNDTTGAVGDTVNGTVGGVTGGGGILGGG